MDKPPPAIAGTIVLKGGAEGVRLSSDSDGRLIAELIGKVHSHDAAPSDKFVIARQDGAQDYRNALRGFKHGVDKIDLSQVGVRSFDELVISKRSRATVNGLSQIHGVSVEIKAPSADRPGVELIYLDALDVSQIDEADFIYADEGALSAAATMAPPGARASDSLGVVERPPATQLVAPAEIQPFPASQPAGSRPVTTPQHHLRASGNVERFGPAWHRGNAPSHLMIDVTDSWDSGPLSKLFVKPEGDTLSYSATLPNGEPLPPWLTLDTTHNRLGATAESGVVGTYSVNVTATNQDGLTATSVLELQVQSDVLNIATFEKVDVSDTQVAINESESFSSVKATGGTHVLLQSGTLSSATLKGDGANRVTIAGSFNDLIVGNGDNVVNLAGSGAKVLAGDGANTVTSTDALAKIVLGDGNNSVSGHFSALTAGNGNNTVSGKFRDLTVGNGDDIVTSTGPIARVTLGGGRDVATIRGAISTVNVGHGNYTLDFAGSLGKLNFSEDVFADRLWFRQLGQDLDISLIGSSEAVTLKDWYASSPHQASDITSGDGKRLRDDDVENLVQAMAAFDPPSSGQTTLPPAYQTVLAPVIAANWQ